MPLAAVAPESRIYYETTGDGPPVLFFSGTGWRGAHGNWETVPHFPHRIPTIIHAYRGTGRSDRPAGPYCTRQFAQDGVALLDALGIREPVHVIGHSMGGRVAQWMALGAPERVRSLVLVASGPGPMPGREWTAGIPVPVVWELVELGWPG